LLQSPQCGHVDYSVHSSCHVTLLTLQEACYMSEHQGRSSRSSLWQPTQTTGLQFSLENSTICHKSLDL